MIADSKRRAVLRRKRRMRKRRQGRHVYWLAMLLMFACAGFLLLIVVYGGGTVARAEKINLEFSAQIVYWPPKVGYLLQARPDFVNFGRQRSDLLSMTPGHLASMAKVQIAPEYAPPLPAPDLKLTRSDVPQLPLPSLIQPLPEDGPAQINSTPSSPQKQRYRASQSLKEAGFQIALPSPAEMPSNITGRAVFDVVLNAEGVPEFWLVLEGKAEVARAAERLLLRAKGKQAATGRVTFDLDL